MYKEDFRIVVQEFKPLVYSLTKKFSSLWSEDLVQVGMIALYRANIAYQPSLKNKFITLAYTYMFRDMANFMRDKSQIVKTPARKYEKGELCTYLPIDKKEYFISNDNQDTLIDSEFFILNFRRLLIKARFTSKDQDILWDYFIANVPIRFLQDRYNCTKQNLYVKISRLVKRLRKFIKVKNYNL